MAELEHLERARGIDSPKVKRQRVDSPEVITTHLDLHAEGKLHSKLVQEINDLKDGHETQLGLVSMQTHIKEDLTTNTFALRQTKSESDANAKKAIASRRGRQPRQLKRQLKVNRRTAIQSMYQSTEMELKNEGIIDQMPVVTAHRDALITECADAVTEIKGVAKMNRCEVTKFIHSPEFTHGEEGSMPKIDANANPIFKMEMLNWVSKDDPFITV